ncbi:MAG TPA: hypothetical protein VGH36_05340 [Acetobacteraceae bacterium]
MPVLVHQRAGYAQRGGDPVGQRLAFVQRGERVGWRGEDVGHGGGI